MLPAARLKLAAQACIYAGGPAAPIRARIEGVPLGKGHPFIHVAAGESIGPRRVRGITVKGLSEAGDGGFTQHVPSTPGEAQSARICALA